MRSTIHLIMEFPYFYAALIIPLAANILLLFIVTLINTASPGKEILASTVSTVASLALMAWHTQHYLPITTTAYLAYSAIILATNTTQATLDTDYINRWLGTTTIHSFFISTIILTAGLITWYAITIF